MLRLRDLEHTYEVGDSEKKGAFEEVIVGVEKGESNRQDIRDERGGRVKLSESISLLYLLPEGEDIGEGMSQRVQGIIL